MMPSKVYKGDIGTFIYLFTNVDLTDVTSTDVKVKKPDGTIDTWTGAVYNTDHILYEVQSGDLDQAGTYLLQSYITAPNWVVHGTTVELEVYDEYK